MAIKQEHIKGRAKIAAGAVTGNKELENEGRLDRIAGDAKVQLDKAAGKAKELLGHGTSQATSWVDQAKSGVEGLIDKIKR